VRKELSAFADFNNRELLDVGNPHLFVFARFEHAQTSRRVLVVANFDKSPQHLNLEDLGRKAYFRNGAVRDLYSGEKPAMFKDDLVIPPCQFYWLTDQ
jgi:amylosucrase